MNPLTAGREAKSMEWIQCRALHSYLLLSGLSVLVSHIDLWRSPSQRLTIAWSLREAPEFIYLSTSDGKKYSWDLSWVQHTTPTYTLQPLCLAKFEAVLCPRNVLPAVEEPYPSGGSILGWKPEVSDTSLVFKGVWTAVDMLRIISQH